MKVDFIHPDGTINNHVVIDDALVWSGYCTTSDGRAFQAACDLIRRTLEADGAADLGNGYELRASKGEDQ